MRTILAGMSARRRLSIPVVWQGVALIAFGVLLIPYDPPLEQVWDCLHDRVPTECAAWLLTRSADRYANFVLLAAILCIGSGIRKRRLAKAYLVAAIGSALIGEAVKWVVGRARPDFCGEINLFDPLTSTHGFHSFPSGHAVNAGVMALFLGLAFPRARALAIAWALLVGFARVTLDRHFFGDVVAGWGLAVVAYALAVRHWKLLEHESAGALVEPDQEPAAQASPPGSRSRSKRPCEDERISCDK